MLRTRLLCVESESTERSIHKSSYVLIVALEQEWTIQCRATVPNTFHSPYMNTYTLSLNYSFTAEIVPLLYQVLALFIPFFLFDACSSPKIRPEWICKYCQIVQ